jgi:hypothetical protein
MSLHAIRSCGSIEDLKYLIDKAHSLNLTVLLDVVSLLHTVMGPRILLDSFFLRVTLFSSFKKTGAQPREQKHVGWLEHDGRHGFLLFSRRRARRSSAGVFADKGLKTE